MQLDAPLSTFASRRVRAFGDVKEASSALSSEAPDALEWVIILRADRAAVLPHPIGHRSQDRFVPIESAGTLLRDAVERHRDAIVASPQFRGLVVRLGDPEFGVVPRPVLLQAAHALAGEPVMRSVGEPIWFQCSIDAERRSIRYFDPHNPPTCSQGHPMELVLD